MRVVLDTNVILSGLMRPDGTPGQLIRYWLAHEYTLVLSQELLKEVELALYYPKVRTRIRRNDAELNAFLSMLRLLTEQVAIADTHADVPADADDAKVLATLIASRADWLVTGDRDLPALRNIYPILTPAEFFQRFF